MAATSDLEPMPVVRALADFDRNSGNALERLVFNHRRTVLVICAIVTVALALVAGARLVVRARSDC